MNRRKLLLAASISCWAAAIVPASAQQFELIPGVSLTQVAAGRAEVWGVNASQQVYRFNATTSQFAKVAGTLTQVAVGGGSLLEADAVWGLNFSNEIFQYNFSTQKLVQVQGELTQITVGVGGNDSCHPYEVWGVNASQQVFRYNYCTVAWDNIPGGPVTFISTGGSDVWGLYNYPLSTPISQYNFGTQEWVAVPAPAFSQAGYFSQIAVGVDDVWIRSAAFYVYHYQPSLGFVPLPANQPQTYDQIATGGDGAWGLTTSGQPVRFDPNAQIAIEVPGNFSQISVGSGAGVWAVNAAGQVFTFVR
jgi:hypothetical protein